MSEIEKAYQTAKTLQYLVAAGVMKLPSQITFEDVTRVRMELRKLTTRGA